MSTMRQQQWSTKSMLCKQKSIDDKASDSHSSSRRILRKQLSVDHVTSSLKHASSSGAPIELNLWQVDEPNLRIVTSNVIKKRAQFAVNSSINKQDLINSCLNKTMKSVSSETTAVKSKDKININIFLSHDVHQDDGYSDTEVGPQIAHKPAAKTTTSSSSTAGLRSTTTANNETSNSVNARLSASTRRAQFQASRRIMSAPIRPMNVDDAKNKRKVRKKKVIRDKDVDESPDEYAEELEDMKQPMPIVAKNLSKKQQQPMRPRTILGCDQMGIETLVSMLNSGESDSEKECDKDKEKDKEKEIATPQTIIKNNAPRIRSLRKTVSFQEEDSQLQAITAGKDSYNIRRSSVVPFAGRMRNTRSLFGQEICNLYMNNTSSCSSSSNSNEEPTMMSKNENDLNSSNQQQQQQQSMQDESKEKSKAKTKNFDETSDRKKSQDLLSQPREEECWRLYEKMKKTGLNISYDTILRGILKPSELRLLEKQKKLLGDIEEKNLEYHELEKQQP